MRSDVIPAKKIIVILDKVFPTYARRMKVSIECNGQIEFRSLAVVKTSDGEVERTLLTGSYHTQKEASVEELMFLAHRESHGAGLRREDFDRALKADWDETRITDWLPLEPSAHQ